MKRESAFTLIELLIASAIFVLVMTAIYSSFYIGIFSFRDIEDLLNTYQSTYFIIGRINADLRNAFVYSRLDSGFKGGPSQMSFVTIADAFWDEKIISEVILVTYKYENGKLWRIYQDLNRAIEEESEMKVEEMTDNVEIRFEYIKSTAGLSGFKFKNYWGLGDLDAGQEYLTLPLAVRIILTVGSKNKRRFVRTIFLPSGG